MHHCWVVESFETSNIADKNVPIMGIEFGHEPKTVVILIFCCSVH